MPVETWLTIELMVPVFLAFVFEWAQADVIFLLAAPILLTFGVRKLDKAIGGSCNPALVTVAALFVVAAGRRETGFYRCL